MFKRSFFALILGLIFSLAVANQVLDFTYSQYIQDATSHGYRTKGINIYPSSKNNEDYEFPKLCKLHDKLKISGDSRSPTPYKDQDEHLEKLKSRFIQLLQLSERMKHTRLNAQDLSEAVKKHTVKEQDFSQQIQQLTQEEQSLKKLQDSIEEQTANLNRLLSIGGGNSNSNLALESAIQFQIQALQIKITYLQKMERDLVQKQHQNKKDEKSKGYFQELKNKFDNEGEIISDINTIFKDQFGARDLQEKIKRSEVQIEALTLMIKYKEDCENKREQMLKQQQANSQIHNVIANLKAKKRENGGKLDIYCQASAEKLEEQIKKILIFLNYSFSCAEGKFELLQKLKTQQNNHLVYISQLKGLKSNNYQALLQKYKTERTNIQISIEKLRGTLSIEKYSHNISDVRRLIKEAKVELSEAIERKKSLPPSKPSSGDSNQKEIKRLVERIKNLKSSYCQQNHKYEENSRSLWSKVHRYEEETRLEMKLRSLLHEEQSKLERLERRFNEERRSLVSQIQ